MPNTERYGSVRINPDELVRSFEEKGDARSPGWINAGIYLLNRQLLASIPAGIFVSLEREIFPKWAGHSLYGYRSEGRFLDIGTPESYAAAEDFFDTEILP